MSTVISVGGGNHNVTIYGNGTVSAGNGNDTIWVHEKGAIVAGNGNDSITLGQGTIHVGDGKDTISLYGPSSVTETGKSGHDTITLGFGNDTVFEAGHATVTGAFGSASVDGGVVSFVNSGWQTHAEIAISGNVTLIGGEYANQFVGGTGKTVMEGAFGPDTFVGGSGHDTMIGGHGANVFEFLASEAGGQHVITNFVGGQDQLYLEGQSLSYLQAHHDITVSGGNTYISLDGGKTTLVLKGITNLTSSDITTHKPT